MSSRFPVRLMICLVLLASSLGCAASTTSESEEHHGHIIPEHKPDSFVHAVSDLHARNAKRGNWDDTQRQEFEDIVNWLPELAAKTDLEKADWDAVHKISQSIATKVSDAEFEVADELGRLEELSEKAMTVDKYSRQADFQQGE